MRYTIENVEAYLVASELARRGIEPRQRLRVFIETLDDAFPLARVAMDGGAFDLLFAELDIYDERDIKSASDGV